MRTLLVILLCCICFRVLPVAGQESTLTQQTKEAKIPKVGLVLSGGGAKGFAHIGVIKVLEEAGVQIDYIGGTSMGAFVGGLYASGYTATELDSVFREVNFTNLIRDKVERSQKTNYERQADERYAVALPFDNFKLQVPSAISKGQNTYNRLVRLVDHIDQTQFDKLPIPFLCIATNVVTGEEVLLEEGYLPEVISASGALPSLFRPVEIDGALYTDGGVTNNYPVEALKAKGVDIIIGVDVQDNLRSRKNLQSATDVLIQVNNFRTIEAMKDKRKLTDIYIKPDIDEFSVVSFNDIDDIINKGSAKAKEQWEALVKLGKSQQQSERPTRTTYKYKDQDSINIKEIELSGNKRYTNKYVLGKLDIVTPEKTTYKKLEQGINNLAISQNFGRIDYKLTDIDHGKNLKVNLTESENKQQVKLSLHYDDLYRSGALINYTRKRNLFKEDVLSFDFVVGENIRYQADYRIDQSFWAVGARSALNAFDQGINPEIANRFSPFDFNTVRNLNLEYQDITNQLYIQTLFVKTFSLEVGIQHKFLSVDTETLGDQVDPNINFRLERSNFFGGTGELLFDSLNNGYFPSSGIYFKGDFDLYLFSDDFNSNFTEFSIANSRFKYAKGLTPHLSLVSEIAGGFKIGGDEISSLDFLLGGYGNNYINNITSFLGYDFLSLSGDGYVKAGFDLDYNFFTNHHLTLSANFANVGDSIFSSGEWLTTPDFTGYGLGYGFETFLGPLQIKYSISPELLQSEWFVSLGFWF